MTQASRVPKLQSLVFKIHESRKQVLCNCTIPVRGYRDKNREGSPEAKICDILQGAAEYHRNESMKTSGSQTLLINRFAEP